MTSEFSVGDKVRVIALPTYVKTAEPMPMLRPANVIRLGKKAPSWADNRDLGAYDSKKGPTY